MSGCAIVPAYDAAHSVGDVVRSLVRLWPEAHAVIVVDDGSSDATATIASNAGARVVRHAENRGKGAALRTGLCAAHEAGFDVAVTVDADGEGVAGATGGVTVRRTLDALARSHPALERRVRDELGAVRVHVNLFVGADNVRDLDGLD